MLEKKKVSGDQELVQSEPKFCHQNQNGIRSQLLIDIVQRKYIGNRVSGSPKKWLLSYLKSEYDQEIPQSHTADRPTATRERATEHQQSQEDN